MFFHCHSFDGIEGSMVVGMSGRVESGFHCLCNFSQAVPWNKLATKSPQGEAKPSAKLIWSLKNHHVLFWVLNKQKLATTKKLIHIFQQQKKHHRSDSLAFFFWNQQKSIPRRWVEDVGPDVWLWLDSNLEARTIFDSAIHSGSLGGFALLQFVATV